MYLPSIEQRGCHQSGCREQHVCPVSEVTYVRFTAMVSRFAHAPFWHAFLRFCRRSFCARRGGAVRGIRQGWTVHFCPSVDFVPENGESVARASPVRPLQSSAGCAKNSAPAVEASPSSKCLSPPRSSSWRSR